MTTVENMSKDGGFRVTGRLVLFSLIGFFGLITVANIIMIWLAVSTNTGVVEASSYRAGNAYQAELDAAQAQAERNWAVSADVARTADGVAFDISVRDGDGAPVGGLEVSATLASHVSQADDRRVTLAEGEIGRYRGAAEAVVSGNWLLIIDAMRGDDRLYRSENRVMLK
ncbi:FixH family protein [Microbaculum marinisediminis]|uniref:FixH family protein n=1 Tax=Microbaculum marinisediminis TaxID=2931392 RepID=A0AAW5QRD2_9HYPH|nr:FixH family protein [Microbaculum sp. A6E488]MCT8970641.1 FixH family protein [Microbaculum sp. A6E488]